MKKLYDLVAVIIFCLYFLNIKPSTSIEVIVRKHTATTNSACANYTAYVKDNKADIYFDLFHNARELEIYTDVKASINDELNYRTVVKRNIKYCAFIKAPRREIMFNVFYQELIKNGHWFTKCPIESGKYWAKNISLVPEIFPPVGPNWYFRSVTVFSFLIPKKTKCAESIVIGKVQIS